MIKDNQLYCSLDIETSGFDPLKDEILEVGFVFFEPAKGAFKITKEWTQVFKPSKEVHQSILALTGITQKELDEAPKFSEHHKELQKEISEAIIVGHNIEFDIRFLESFGIKTSGKSIDTLQLSQFLLPTHHSYNLENLMHFFGVAHKEAHRALADSKAALKVLEKLLGVYQGFPTALKKEIKELVSGQKFYWKEFLEISVPIVKQKKLLTSLLDSSQRQIDFKFEADAIYAFPPASEYLPGVLQSLSESKEKFLVTLPKTSQVHAFWKAGLCEPLFKEENLFNLSKFNKFIKKPELSAEEALFALKILVWKTVNWQSETILDLNLSFFGGQFKEAIIGGKTVKANKAQVLCTDHETFISLENKNEYKNRTVVISGLSEFEHQASSNISVKISWGYITYALRSIYNPELFTGDIKLKQEVEEALNATDLFFGLVLALMGNKGETFSYVKINSEASNSLSYGKIQQASENYSKKLATLNKKLKSSVLDNAILSLEAFFKQEDNRVKWLEISERRCVLNNSPIDIRPLVKQIVSPFAKLSAIDDLGAFELFKYYKARLGFEAFKQHSVNIAGKFGQKDLFSFLKPAKAGKIKVKITAGQVKKENLLSASGGSMLPAVLLLPSLAAAREFQAENYKSLDSGLSLLVQNSSGGSNKLLRNFSINPKSLLVATDKFVLKYLKNNYNGVDAVKKLPVKTLVICRLPFEQFTHPYYEALAETHANSFMEFSIPLALNNFHSILKFFWTPSLKTVYIYDSKLSKDYAKAFKNYLEILPNVLLEEI
ncbi:MAG: hypothetical protein COT92_01710 [Candidatus Doudnabacteria bacterium CG10_big_fil_rev_8_21_14_0_10_42_18]|uniref:Exonuclease domain-containing protein n=1 Tax=Candidatus Doudnabacteria bacterium CG10_big_fil_rev_8_21_14_0_10_42_18 TaxID=1974552 RepID=A0A2H0VB59_9BACT|nr:MAG: hypothetical protein COT92_01710 [Candidatus Doudnabacteria bacterium CG10_big_fil_rev_8_21_14_0_10_42_18]